MSEAFVRGLVYDFFVRASREFLARHPLAFAHSLHALQQEVGAGMSLYLMEYPRERRKVRRAIESYASCLPFLIETENLEELLNSMWINSEEVVARLEIELAKRGTLQMRSVAQRFGEVKGYARIRDGVIRELEGYSRGIISSSILPLVIQSAFGTSETLHDSYVKQFEVPMSAITAAAIETGCPEPLAQDIEERLLGLIDRVGRQKGWVKNQVDTVFGVYSN
jgi:hypothetical protein